MKVKDICLSIILHGFLGYLFVVFMNHLTKLANAMNNFFTGGSLMLAGVMLFGAISDRVAPYHEYKFSHPLKLAGSVSFVLVVIITLLI
ncbi:hypothetical protein CU633_15690 [Bacillus sp. V3-13]|uniref:hypothetical protein n=1 Tax=Bacillus sp. V3-13 TaxID=2053728 RepID=UPI000C763F34|nr:hypothetical protein [Bacillus sp. V3-13]PLR76407.1 hypothetical protein CU633_15690 [Bacillus sp. V3-13]